MPHSSNTRGRYQGKFIYRWKKSHHRGNIIRHWPWESYFNRKSYMEKRELIQRPWLYPVACSHLATIQIQRVARGFLCRKHFKNPIQNKDQKKEPILLKKFLESHKGDETVNVALFQSWCATRIQAWWKMLPFFKSFRLQRFPIYHIAAMQIQFTWRMYYQECYVHLSQHSPTVQSAVLIQNTWRRYSNIRVFRYYRDLLSFRNCGKAAMMLKVINPGESNLIDPAAGIHVRFRLGGSEFPPAIYYKIFTHHAVCDLNAFSPKDYTTSRRKSSLTKGKGAVSTKKKSFIRVGTSIYGTTHSEEISSGWYQRIENNGWRPIAVKTLAEAELDPLYKATKDKPIAFHYSKVQRAQDIQATKREKKRQWLRKMYTEGLAKSKNEEKSVDFSSKDWESDADQLLEWSDNLNFDDYVDSWKTIATAGSLH